MSPDANDVSEAESMRTNMGEDKTWDEKAVAVIEGEVPERYQFNQFAEEIRDAVLKVLRMGGDPRRLRMDTQTSDPLRWVVSAPRRRG